MDLNRKIGQKAAVYPTKTTMNLAMRERSDFAPGRLLPFVIVLVVVVGLFGKFAVVDRLARASRMEAQLADLNRQLDALNASMADYDEITNEYARYSISWMDADEQTVVKRTDVLNLIEKQLMPNGQVLQFSATSDVLSIEIDDVTLDDISRLVQGLYALPSVTNVEVYTATSQLQLQSGTRSNVSLTITMTADTGEAEGAEQN